MADATAPQLLSTTTAYGDDRLILAQNLAEWVGIAPTLEEEMSIANIALDVLGHAKMFYDLAAELEGEGRTADDFAYQRYAHDFRCILLVQLPKGDWAQTIVRQLMFAAFDTLQADTMAESSHEGLAAIGAKSRVESKYHLKHAVIWTERLAGGTEESHRRMQAAVDDLWRFGSELFELPEGGAKCVEAGVLADPASLKETWLETVTEPLRRYDIALPEVSHSVTGGREGKHSEHLVPLLTELQSVARAFPGAQW